VPESVGEGRQLSKILVVDDDSFSASLIDNTLRSSGFISSFTTDSTEALDRIEKELPDLVVLDVAMPEIDGFELCRRVRSHPALAFTPIIFVTRKGELEERVRGLEVGGNDYIAKPFEPRELVARVRSHLTRLAALRQMAIRDGLTRCFNHRYFKSRLDQELQRAARYDQPLAIAMVDADHFKRVNDEHGHLAGDLVLAHLANIILACVRGTDVVARYGGEEFALLMIHSGEREAQLIGERIRTRVEATRFPISDAKGDTVTTLELTVSTGVAVFQRGDDAAALIGRADRALYDAKEQGRNAVRISSPGEAEAEPSSGRGDES
jgi:diguanylate cyclase (GGDEF)-like protein